MPGRDVYVIEAESGGPSDDRAPRGSEPGQRDRVRREDRHADDIGSVGGWPRLGASLSLFVSGTGHLLHRRWKVGVFYTLVFCFAPSLHYFLRSSWPDLLILARQYGFGEIDLLFGLFLLDSLLLAMLLTAVYAAYAIGLPGYGEYADPTPTPIVAALASLLVPGWGQIVNGQVSKALAFLSVFYAEILVVLAWWAIPGPIERLVLDLGDPFRPVVVVAGLATFGVATWALSLYDALLVARYRRLLLS